jgi:hypothetical protein
MFGLKMKEKVAPFISMAAPSIICDGSSSPAKAQKFFARSLNSDNDIVLSPYIQFIA